MTKLIAGLAAMAIGLGKETSNHTAELITPILTCLTGLFTILTCLVKWTTVANCDAGFPSQMQTAESDIMLASLSTMWSR